MREMEKDTKYDSMYYESETVALREGELDDEEYDHLDEEEDDQPVPSRIPYSNTEIPSSSTSAMCSVCGRTPNHKFRLFRWPKNEETRSDWLERLGMDSAVDTTSSYICAFHFIPEHFQLMNGKIFWMKGAYPKYRLERDEEIDNHGPYPWETNFIQPIVELNNSTTNHQKQNQQPLELRAAVPRCVQDLEKVRQTVNMDYEVSFRSSLFSNRGGKRKSTHEVAIVTRMDESGEFHEFSYNRTSVDGTKFYACLKCRKSNCKVKDVVRTIHISGYELLSKKDPFDGHHFLCTPFKPDTDSGNSVLFRLPSGVYRHPAPQPMHMTERDDFEDGGVVYIDDNGVPVQHVWTTVDPDTGELIEMTDASYYNEVVHEGDIHEFETDIVPDEKPLPQFPTDLSEPLETKNISDEDILYHTGSTNGNNIPNIPRTAHKRRKNAGKSGKLQCHLCLRRLSSTQMLVAHLQNHIENAPSCINCQRKFSVDRHRKRDTLCKRCKRKQTRLI